MATNKKTKTKPKKAGKKAMPAKKRAKKSAIPKKKTSAKKKPVREKAAAKTKAVGKRTVGAKPVSTPKTKTSGQGVTAAPVRYPRARSGEGSAGQSGDLQGLSRVERADPESVDELLEEGNAFEADVVKGVEDAGNADEQEVHTHEVPEDDVPGEYLDEE